MEQKVPDMRTSGKIPAKNGTAFAGKLLKNYGKEADSDLVHVLAEMKLQGYTQLLNKDYSHEKFLKLSKMLKICSDCGYQVIEEETARMQ